VGGVTQASHANLRLQPTGSGSDTAGEMPAPRNCRSCGAPLPADVRWCARCYEPARELSPRAPLHRGDFVGPAIATGGHRPHWSRWQRSATTFGPGGRIACTVAFLLTIPLALSWGMFLWVLFLPVTAPFVLGAIWTQGWVVPDEPDLPPLPDRPKPAPPPPTRAEVAFRAARWVVVVGACAAFAYGPLQVKAAVLGLSTLVGMAAFYRGFLSR
jgi:hypothetical protein